MHDNTSNNNPNQISNSQILDIKLLAKRIYNKTFKIEQIKNTDNEQRRNICSL